MRHSYALISALILASMAESRAQDATIVESHVEVECTGANSDVRRYRKVVEVHNKQGERVTSFGVMLDKDTELRKFSGQVTDASGTVVRKFKRGDLIRSEYSEHLKTDNYRLLLESYHALRYPVTVTYEWEIEDRKNLFSYPVFFPLSGYDVDLKKATYRIITTPNNTLRYKALNFTPEVKVSQQGDKTITEVEVHDLPAVKDYAYSLDPDRQLPLMYFAPERGYYEGRPVDMTSWQTYGLWDYQLQQGRDRLPAELVDRLHAMTDTCADVKTKVGIVRRFMGETTRYVSIQLGIGGYQTMTAEEVVSRGVGDCKALTNYFCSMLHALGIPAEAVLIGTEDLHLLPDMPNFQQINHVIARVPLPTDTFWVECTSPKMPFDHVPPSLQGHDVLILTPEGGKLAKTPVVPDSLNVFSTRSHIEVKPDGRASFTITNSYAEAPFYRMLSFETLSTDEQRKSLLNNYDKITKGQITQLDVRKKDVTMTVDWKVEASGWARVNGSRIFIPLMPDVYSNLRNAKEPPHVIDLEMGGSVTVDTVVIEIPEGYEVESLPKSSVIDYPFGDFSLQVTSPSARRIEVFCRRRYRSGIYGVELYDRWTEFRAQMSKLSKQEIVIRSAH